jgi:predicted nucleotidyltransferase
VKRTLLKSSRKRLAAAIADRLIELRDDILTAYVFGSFVTEELFSDIDVGILTRIMPERPLMLEIDLENELEKITPCPVDVRVLNGAPLSFTQNVVRRGTVILDREPNLRADFEGMVLKKYFDFYPFRARYLSEVTDAPL